MEDAACVCERFGSQALKTNRDAGRLRGPLVRKASGFEQKKQEGCVDNAFGEVAPRLDRFGLKNANQKTRVPPAEKGPASRFERFGLKHFINMDLPLAVESRTQKTQSWDAESF